MEQVFELTLRAADGREKQVLAWFPTETVRQDYYDKARKRGLTITENKVQPLDNNDNEQI